MIFHSIRWRLQIWYALFLICVLSGFGFTAHRLQRTQALRQVDQELQDRAGVLLGTLGRRPPPGPEGIDRPPPWERDPGEFPPPPPRFDHGSDGASLFAGIGSNAFY